MLSDITTDEAFRSAVKRDPKGKIYARFWENGAS
jgi:hypothetical protein